MLADWRTSMKTADCLAFRVNTMCFIGRLLAAPSTNFAHRTEKKPQCEQSDQTTQRSLAEIKLRRSRLTYRNI